MRGSLRVVRESILSEGELRVTTEANQIGGTRLVIMAAEYMLATQKGQIDEVAKVISKEFETDIDGVMASFRAVIEELKIKESLLRMVKDGLMVEKDGGYSLTVLGEVYTKHQIKNDPVTKDFYKKLLRSHGVDPSTDELTA